MKPLDRRRVDMSYHLSNDKTQSTFVCRIGSYIILFSAKNFFFVTPVTLLSKLNALQTPKTNKPRFDKIFVDLLIYNIIYTSGRPPTAVSLFCVVDKPFEMCVCVTVTHNYCCPCIIIIIITRRDHGVENNNGVRRRPEFLLVLLFSISKWPRGTFDVFPVARVFCARVFVKRFHPPPK